MMSENEKHDEQKETEERENYTLKEIIEKDKRGDLDDLNTEEVREYNRYTAYKATIEAEIAAKNELDIIVNEFRERERDLRQTFNDKLGQIEREGILNSFLADLKQLDEGGGTDE